MDMYCLLFSVAIKFRDSHPRAIRSASETSEGSGSVTCISFLSFPRWLSLTRLYGAKPVSVVGWQMKIKPWWYWTFPAEPAGSGLISLHPTWLLHFSWEQKLRDDKWFYLCLNETLWSKQKCAANGVKISNSAWDSFIKFDFFALLEYCMKLDSVPSRLLLEPHGWVCLKLNLINGLCQNNTN